MSILNSYYAIRKLGDFLVVGNHHNRLRELLACHLQKTLYVLTCTSV